MPDWSRRQLLQTLGAGGVLALAGCQDSRSGSADAPTLWRSPVEDLQALKARNAEGKPLIESAGATDEGSDGDDVPPGSRVGHHLTDEDSVDSLEFADLPAAVELQAFVRDTDLATESVFLFQDTIGECYERRIAGVYREEDGFDIQLCEELRPADVTCSPDARDVVAIAIRLPFAGEDVSSTGFGYGGECGDTPTMPMQTVGDPA